MPINTAGKGKSEEMIYIVELDSVAFHATIDRLEKLNEISPEPYLPVLIAKFKNAKCRGDSPEKKPALLQ